VKSKKLVKESSVKKVVLMIVVFLFVAVMSVSCASEASRASSNLSKGADQFEVERRIIYYNSITNTYIQTIEGRCSIEVDNVDNQLEVTCKVGDSLYLKHFLGLADNTSYFVEQLSPEPVSGYRYRVIFRPETILPAFELDMSN